MIRYLFIAAAIAAYAYASNQDFEDQVLAHQYTQETIR